MSVGQSRLTNPFSLIALTAAWACFTCSDAPAQDAQLERLLNSVDQPHFWYQSSHGSGGQAAPAPGQNMQMPAGSGSGAQYQSGQYQQQGIPGSSAITPQMQAPLGSPDYGGAQYSSGQYPQAMPGSNFGAPYPSAPMPGAAFANQANTQFQNTQYTQTMPGFANSSNPMLPGTTGYGLPQQGVSPFSSHPVLSLIKEAFGAPSTQTDQQSVPQQRQSGGIGGIFRTMFGAPTNAQEAESRAQDDLNTAQNQKAQAIDSHNSISGESDKSLRRSLANDANGHANQARAASDRVYALSCQFPNSSRLSDMATQARDAADYARSQADEAQSEAGGGW